MVCTGILNFPISGNSHPSSHKHSHIHLVLCLLCSFLPSPPTIWFHLPIIPPHLLSPIAYRPLFQPRRPNTGNLFCSLSTLIYGPLRRLSGHRQSPEKSATGTATVRVQHTHIASFTSPLCRQRTGQAGGALSGVKFIQCKANVKQTHTAMNRKVGALSPQMLLDQLSSTILFLF